MSLRALAEQDLGVILEDAVTGFGFPITVTSPGGTTSALTGYSNDIGGLIDPDTGQAVSGRFASITLRISSLTAASLGLPQGIEDESLKPWIIAFDDISGNSFTFKVSESMPDRALGVVTCLLELYE